MLSPGSEVMMGQKIWSTHLAADLRPYWLELQTLDTAVVSSSTRKFTTSSISVNRRWHNPTFHMHFDSFQSISEVIPGLARVRAHVEHGSIVNQQAGHSIIVFLHHIFTPVVIPHILRSWVAHGGTLEPNRWTNINLRVFKLSDLWWWIWKEGRGLCY